MNHCFRIPSFTKSSWNLSGGLVCIFSLVNSPISDHDIEVSTWFYLTKHTDTSNPPKKVSRFFPCACRISVNIKYTSKPPPKKSAVFLPLGWVIHWQLLIALLWRKIFWVSRLEAFKHHWEQALPRQADHATPGPGNKRRGGMGHL